MHKFGQKDWGTHAQIRRYRHTDMGDTCTNTIAKWKLLPFCILFLDSINVHMAKNLCHIMQSRTEFRVNRNPDILESEQKSGHLQLLMEF